MAVGIPFYIVLGIFAVLALYCYGHAKGRD